MLAPACQRREIGDAAACHLAGLCKGVDARPLVL